MGYIKIKGLPSIADLSDEERKQWDNQHSELIEKYKNQGMTPRELFNQLDKVYRNGKFIETFGEDTFKSMPLSARDEMYTNYNILEASKNTYGEDPEFEAISNLTPTAQKYLMDNGYQTQSTINKLYADNLKQVVPESGSMYSYFDPGNFSMNPTTLASSSKEAAQNTAYQVFSKASEISDDEKKRRVQPEIDSLKSDLYDKLDKNELSSEDVNKLFNYVVGKRDSYVNNTSIEDEIYIALSDDNDEKKKNLLQNPITGETVKISDGHAGSRFFQGYLDTEEYTKEDGTKSRRLKMYSPEEIEEDPSKKGKAVTGSHITEEMSLQDKLNFVADYLVMKQTYGEGMALQDLDIHAQNYIHSKEDFSDWTGKTVTGIATKALSGIGQVYTTGRAIAIGTGLSEGWGLWGDEEWGGKAAGDYLNGKGSHVAGFLDNPAYWFGVDQFNTFSVEDINAAYDNGGVSDMKVQTAYGHEKDFFSGATISNAVSMMGYMIATYGYNKAIESIAQAGKAVQLMSWAKAGQALSEPVWMQRISNLTSLVSAVQIGAAYADGTRREVETDSNQKTDKIVDENTEHLVDLQMQTPEAKQLINQYVANAKQSYERNKQLNQGKENNGSMMLPFDEKTVRQQAEGYLRAQYYQENRKAVEGSEDIKRLRDLAVESGTKAFFADLVMESLKTWKLTETINRWKLPKKYRNMQNPEAMNFTSDAEGRLQYNGSRWLKTVQPFYGGAVDNYLDDVVSDFGKAFGMQDYYNLSKLDNDPSAWAEVGQFLVDLGAGIAGDKGMFSNLLDEQKIYDGWVGGLGAVTTLGLGSKLMSKFDGRQVSKPHGFFETLDNYIYNPILRSFVESDPNRAVEAYNNIITAHKEELKDLVPYIAANSYEEASSLSGSEKAAQDAKLINDFVAVRDLYRSSSYDILSQSGLVQSTIGVMDAIHKGDFSSQEAQNVVTSMMQNDKSLTQEEAQQRVQKNVERFLKLQETYDSTIKNIRATKNFRNADESTIHAVAFMQMVRDNWQSRANEMGDELHIMMNKFTYDTTSLSSELRGFEFHSDEVIDNYIDNLEKELKMLDDSKLDSKDETERLIAERNRYIKDSIETKLDYLREAKKNREAHAGEHPIITASDIEAMDVAAAYNMIAYRDKYSQEQQAEIAKFIESIGGEKNITKFEDYSKLLSSIKDVEYTIEKANSHPDLFAEYQDAQKLQSYYYAVAIQTAYIADKEEANILSAVNSNNNPTTLAGVLSKYAPDLLDTVVKHHPELKDTLTPAREVSQVLHDAQKVINKYDNLDKDTKDAFCQVVAELASKCSSEKQFTDALEDAIDNNHPNKELLDSLLNDLSSMSHARDMLRVEQREKNRKALEEAKKKEEEAKRAAEEAAKKAAEEHSEQEENATEEPAEEVTETHNPENAVQVDEGEEIDLDSNAIAEKQIVENGGKATEIPKVDNTDGNNIDHTDKAKILVGNFLPGYNTKTLARDGKLIQRDGTTPASKAYYQWLRDHNIKQQEIIDHELGDYITNNPNAKVFFMMTKPKSKMQKDPDDPMKMNVMMVIPMDAKLEKIHKDRNGGVITSNGKRYLVIGALGYDGRSEAQTKNYNNIRSKLLKNTYSYFDNATDSTDEVYVDESQYTQIQHFMAGRLVTCLTNEQSQTTKNLSELLVDDPQKNPDGLKLADLEFGIQINENFVQTNSNLQVHWLLDAENNNGVCFVLVKAADGCYVPGKLKATTIADLKEESKLYEEIMSDLNSLCSTKYAERKTALDNLLTRLVMSQESGPAILIGTEGIPTITIVDKGNNKIASFTVNASMDKAAFIAAIKQVNFNIQLTSAMLGNSTVRQKYSDAGALRTDLSSLRTSNTFFTVYPVDDEGKPVVFTFNSSSVPSTGEAGHGYKSFLLRGKTYRYRDKQYTDENKNPLDINNPKDRNIIVELTFLNAIEEGHLAPISSRGSFNYYCFSNRDGSFTVVMKHKNHNDNSIKVMTKEESSKFLENYQNENTEEKAREINANQVNEALKNAEEINLFDTPAEEKTPYDKSYDAKYDSLTENTPNSKTLTKEREKLNSQLNKDDLTDEQRSLLRGELDAVERYMTENHIPLTTTDNSAYQNEQENQGQPLATEENEVNDLVIPEIMTNFAEFYHRSYGGRGAKSKAIRTALQEAIKQAGWTGWPSSEAEQIKFLANHGVSLLNLDMQSVIDEIKNGCLK